MSEFVTWMADEGELIDNIDSRVQIVSTSSSSQSSNNLQPVQTVITRSPNEDDGIPVSKSCDDLISGQARSKDPLSRSQSCLSLSGGKYDYVQSKIKQYIDVLNPGQNELPKQFVSTIKATKEEYLEEINNRLMRELEEKNATLLQLQENYEHLLLKYAEAQNKIDNLRFQSSANAESPSRSKYKTKLVIKNIGKPAVYQYKNSGNIPQPPKEETTEKDVRVDRPSTLAVDNHLRTNEREGLKAVTPTDSEGVSSVVTSMSGHSKILTNFDDPDPNKKATLKSDVLEKNLPANDPFDKVKHWQSSLPPLDMIETPDTGLYDLEPEPLTTLSTRYNELPVSDLENIPETPEWAAQTKAASQMGMKKYLRTLSLPSSLTRRNILSQIYKRRNIHTIDVSSPLDCGEVEKTLRPSTPPPEPDQTHCNVIRRKKRPPFLRSSSLPVYEYDSPRSAIRCHVPPLDLDNLTLSEDESKSNPLTTPSFLTNHDCSFQTLNSLNSCMATVSDYSLSRHNLPSLHKSTSITPDRSREMFFFEESREFLSNCCNVCGEMLVPGKAASFHGIHVKSQDGSESRFPICRSMSFNTTSPTRFSSLTSQDPSESFDAYANSLKTRSQITLKALTAHVNNS